MLFRGILLLLRFLLVLVLVRLVLRFVAGVVRGMAGEPKPDRRPGRARGAVDLVRCAACGTHVPADGALAVVAGGAQQRFCSSACRDQAVRGGAGAAPVYARPSGVRFPDLDR